MNTRIIISIDRVAFISKRKLLKNLFNIKLGRFQIKTVSKHGGKIPIYIFYAVLKAATLTEQSKLKKAVISDLRLVQWLLVELVHMRYTTFAHKKCKGFLFFFHSFPKILISGNAFSRTISKCQRTWFSWKTLSQIKSISRSSHLSNAYPHWMPVLSLIPTYVKIKPFIEGPMPSWLVKSSAENMLDNIVRTQDSSLL